MPLILSVPSRALPTFLRRLQTWVSMLRSNGENSLPSTSFVSSSRPTTDPADRNNLWRRSNSTVVRFSISFSAAYGSGPGVQLQVADPHGSGLKSGGTLTFAEFAL